ncbi:MAG: hypothetical protein IKZ58_06910 [Selenomonadaceae bacterium]|nr:hypothetical protein [Selenomonadaceae bacterium]
MLLKVKLFDVYNEQYAATDNILNIEADSNYLLELTMTREFIPKNLWKILRR